MKKVILLVLTFCICISAFAGCSEHVHEFGDWTITKNATCTEAGEQERLCSCGEKQTQAIPETGHTFGSWTTTKAATCTESGEQERVCACGEKQTQAVSATGHQYGEWIIIKAATCTEAGEKEQVCSCGEKQTQTISPLGHNWEAATCKAPKTCKNCGLTEGKIAEHVYNETVKKAATCTAEGEAEQVCKVCGSKNTVKIAKTEHKWTAATCTAPKTCSVCGTTSGSALGHTSSTGTCSRCGEKIMPKVTLPTGELIYSYAFNGSYSYKLYSKVKISSLSYEWDKNGSLIIKFTAEKTYDYEGSSGDESVKFNYKVYDASGVVVANGSWGHGGLKVGEKYKDDIEIYHSYFQDSSSSSYKIVFEDYIY